MKRGETRNRPNHTAMEQLSKYEISLDKIDVHIKSGEKAPKLERMLNGRNGWMLNGLNRVHKRLSSAHLRFNSFDPIDLGIARASIMTPFLSISSHLLFSDLILSVHKRLNGRSHATVLRFDSVAFLFALRS